MLKNTGKIKIGLIQLHAETMAESTQLVRLGAHTGKGEISVQTYIGGDVMQGHIQIKKKKNRSNYIGNDVKR